MADMNIDVSLPNAINVDVNLPSPINTNVTSPTQVVNATINIPDALNTNLVSPTQALIANVSVEGPQGPVGPQGPSGAIGPAGQINTGELDLRYVNLTGDQIISGNKTFIENINVSGTGTFANLNLNSIASLNISGVDIYITNGTVYSNYPIYSSNIVYNTGNQNIAGIKNFYSRPTVNGTGVLLSGEVGGQLPNTIVYITGNQIISGNKTFINNIEVQGTGIFNSLDLSNISEFQFSGVTMNLLNTNIYLSGGWIYISGNPVLTGDQNISTLNLSNIVYTTGNQTINGLKDFTTRPTVNTTPVLLSGENANGLSVLVKNDDSATLLKGQPVYIYGANGNNILVRRALNTGESTSSKTLGLLNQDLAPNGQGYVITEGALEGIDTNSANAGDPIWLGPTGNLIFGLANKPYAPNHLVYLGVIERKQINNGKIYIKVQNGFELQELHNVNIDHYKSLNDGDVLIYNSGSGLWFNKVLETGIFKTGIDALSGLSVLRFGDQLISGKKTFIDNQIFSGNIEVSATGIFNALDLNNIDNLSLSGVDVTITNGVVILTNPISAPNLVYNTGNQTISGVKTFANSGVFISGIDLKNSNLINATPEIINFTSNFNITGIYNSRTIFGNSANQITGHIVSGNPVGFNVSVIQIGSGQIQITGSGIMPILSYNNQYRTAGIGAAVSLIHTGNNGYIMYGNTAI